MPIPPTPDGTAHPLSEIIAEGTVTLPGDMTRPQDPAFLQRMTEVLIDAFWQNYVASLPADVQDQFHAAATKAIEEEDGEDLRQWYITHADFEGNSDLHAIAENVLQELHGKFPSVMREEYPLFSEDDACAAA